MHNHVLIAEDDKDIVELLKLYLESNGFIVSVSYDGLEALSKLDEDVDIVIATMEPWNETTLGAVKGKVK